MSVLALAPVLLESHCFLLPGRSWLSESPVDWRLRDVQEPGADDERCHQADRNDRQPGCAGDHERRRRDEVEAEAASEQQVPGPAKAGAIGRLHDSSFHSLTKGKEQTRISPLFPLQTWASGKVSSAPLLMKQIV